MKTVPSSKGPSKGPSNAMEVSKPRIQSAPSLSVVKRPGKSKVRAVPDFSKLHKKWEKTLQQGKACTKKPCTKVEEFHLGALGNGTECPPQVLNNVSTEEDDENVPPPATFKPDTQALKSITSGKGLGCTTPGRATLAGSSRPSMRVPVSESAATKASTVRTNTKEVSTKLGFVKDMESASRAVMFEADPTALQSIMVNQGLSADAQGVMSARQTLSAPQRTLLAGPLVTGRCTDIFRRSIYYTGPQTTTVHRREFYTEFTQKVVSRLADADAPKTDVTDTATALAKPAAASFARPLPYPAAGAPSTTPKPVVTREKGSIYGKVHFFDGVDPKIQRSMAATAANLVPATNAWRTTTPRTTSKAARVAVTPMPPTPRTPGGTANKARRVLKNGATPVAATPQHDTLATKLKFQEEEDDERLQSLEEAEQKLDAEIAAAQSDSSPESMPSKPLAPPVAETTPIADSKPTRIAFGALSQGEIARRSEPGYDPKNPCKSACNKVSVTMPVCVPLPTPPQKRAPLRCRDLPSSPRSHYNHRSPRVKRPQSPLVTSEQRGHLCQQKSAAAGRDLATTVDILTIPALDKSKLETSLNTSNSPLQQSPSKISQSLGMSPARFNSLEYQVRQVAAVLDKENSPYKQYSPFINAWDKENMTPKSSPKSVKCGDHVDLEKYKLDDDLLALCSPNSKENLQRLSLCSPNKLCSPNSKENLQRCSPNKLSSPNKRPLEEKNALYASPKMRCRKISPRALASVEAFKEADARVDTKKVTEMPYKKKVHWEKMEDIKKGVKKLNVEDLSHSISQTRTQIEDLNQKAMRHVDGSGPKVAENWLIKQMEEIKQRQDQLLILQLKLQGQLEKQSPSTSPTAAASTAVTSTAAAASPAATTTALPRASALLGPCTPSSQSYADFIAANVEDISPYILEYESGSRMPFALCVGAERESERAQQQCSWRESMDRVVPFEVALSVLDDSLKNEDALQTPGKRSLAWSSAVYSPRPVLSGSHQLMQAISPAPINTCLALRSMAERTTQQPQRPQRDLLELSSTENSILETSSLFTTPEYVAYAAQQTPHSNVLSSTASRGPNGQARSSSLMTTTLSFASPRSSPAAVKSSQGSLSLSANLSPCPVTSSLHNAAASSSFVSSTAPNTTPLRPVSQTASAEPLSGKGARLWEGTILARSEARFHDALLDDEVTLYACRVTRQKDGGYRTLNPIASTLADGDEMHFIPIREEPHRAPPSFATVEGSAFSLPIF